MARPVTIPWFLSTLASAAMWIATGELVARRSDVIGLAVFVVGWAFAEAARRSR